MTFVVGAIANNALTNVLAVAWLYALSFNPRFSRVATMFICLVTGALMEISSLAVFYLAPEMTAAGGAINYVIDIALFGGVYVLVLQKGRKLQSCLVVACYICLWVFIYLVVILVFDAHLGDGHLGGMILRLVLNVVALLAFGRLVAPAARRAPVRNGFAYGAFLAIVLIVGNLLSLLLYYCLFRDRMNVAVFALTVEMLVLACLTAYLFVRFNRATARETELRQVELQNRMLAETVADYERMASDARRTRHDQRHHDTAILGYAKAGDAQAIVEYLRDCTADVSAEDARYCPNGAANSVIAAFVQRAAQCGTPVDVQADIPATIPVKAADLVSLLGNMLENAVNACASLAEGRNRRIELIAKPKDGKLVITCENTCDESMRVVDGLPENPGVGTASIAHVAGRYQGDVAYDAEGGRFRCVVLLNVARA